MSINNNHLIIMAGGVGSRFWPKSTIQMPKQFLDILGVGKTLLQLTVDRFKYNVPKSNIWVVTSKKYNSIVSEQLPFLDSNHILLEPCMRNTAPCIAYATWKIKSQFPSANIVVSPSDHIVLNEHKFSEIVMKSLTYISANDKLLTLGISPTRPETGYGYIHAYSELADEIVDVNEFKEKPAKEVAEHYLLDGNYFWNSGIFFWNMSSIENAFRKYLPTLANLFDEGNTHYNTKSENKFIIENFPNCENISIDYGVLERSSNIMVLPTDVGWSDLGTWGALYNILDKDNCNNAIVGEDVKVIDSYNCIIQVPPDRKYVIQGLHDFIVVDDNNVVLICDRKEEQRIKEFSK